MVFLVALSRQGDNCSCSVASSFNQTVFIQRSQKDGTRIRRVLFITLYRAVPTLAEQTQEGLTVTTGQAYSYCRHKQVRQLLL
jgi:hypothetical protein